MKIEAGRLYKFKDPRTDKYAYYYDGKTYYNLNHLPNNAFCQLSVPLPEIEVEFASVDDPSLAPLVFIHDSKGTRIQYTYYQEPEDTQSKPKKNNGGRPSKADAKRALANKAKELTQKGWSRRRVAKSLGVSKDTVQRLVS